MYSFYRFNILSNQGGNAIAIANIAMFDNNEMNVVLGGTASASVTHISPYSPDLAFNQNLSDFWASGNNYPTWLQIQLTSASIVRTFNMSARTGSFFNQIPTHFELLASADGNEWTLIGEYQNLTWSDGETKTFEVAFLPLITTKLYRGTTANLSTYVGEDGNLSYNTETHTVNIHDGVTEGGVPTCGTINAPPADGNTYILDGRTWVNINNV